VAEICAGFFGWQPTRPFVRFGDPGYQAIQPRPADGERAGDLIPFALSVHYFSRQQIGACKYRRVMATISRSVARLAARGLVERSAYGYAMRHVTITEQGRQWPSVNTSAYSKSINRYPYVGLAPMTPAEEAHFIAWWPAGMQALG
jgi:hypothetical protein